MSEKTSIRQWVWIYTSVLAGLVVLFFLVWFGSWLNDRGISDFFARQGQRRLATVRSEVRLGISRQELYSRLGSLNLVPYNSDYAIDRRDPRSGQWYVVREGNWPPSTFTAVRMNGKPFKVTHSPVTVSIGVGMPALGCGTEVDLTIEFDDRDLAKKATYSAPQTECM